VLPAQTATIIHRSHDNPTFEASKTEGDRNVCRCHSRRIENNGSVDYEGKVDKMKPKLGIVVGDLIFDLESTGKISIRKGRGGLDGCKSEAGFRI